MGSSLFIIFINELDHDTKCLVSKSVDNSKMRVAFNILEDKAMFS